MEHVPMDISRFHFLHFEKLTFLKNVLDVSSTISPRCLLDVSWMSPGCLWVLGVNSSCSSWTYRRLAPVALLGAWLSRAHLHALSLWYFAYAQFVCFILMCCAHMFLRLLSPTHKGWFINPDCVQVPQAPLVRWGCSISPHCENYEHIQATVWLIGILYRESNTARSPPPKIGKNIFVCQIWPYGWI